MLEHTVTVEAKVAGADIGADELVAVLQQLEQLTNIAGPVVGGGGEEITMTATMLVTTTSTNRLGLMRDAKVDAVSALGHAMMLAGVVDAWSPNQAPTLAAVIAAV